MTPELHIVQLRVTKKRSGQRVVVNLDDGSSFEIDPELAVQHCLNSGRSIDEGTVEQLQHEDDLLRARRRLTHYLALRVKSVAEAQRYLEKAGFRDSVIEAAVQDALGRDLLDDRRFAERFVRTRLKTGIYGPLRLQADLVSHGIDPALADDVLRPQFDFDRQREAAEELARTRLSRSRSQSRETDRKKLYDFLERRGFQSEIARDVAERLATKK